MEPFQKKLWNPHLKNFENWELSVLDVNHSDEASILEDSLLSLQLSAQQSRAGFFPLAERLAFLEEFQKQFEKSFENLSLLMSMEIQKPFLLAKAECERALDTIQATIDWGRSLLNDDHSLTAKGRGTFSGHSKASSRGVIFAVTPFNFPINLALHKILPAILAGCPVLWRPSPKAQMTSIALLDAIHAAHLPAGFITFAPMTNDSFWKVLKDPRLDAVSFTGSDIVGWKIAQEYRGPLVLELGGMAPVWIDKKLDEKELESALDETIASAFSYSGQSCISAQNLYTNSENLEKIFLRLSEKTINFKCGNFWEESVLCSGVIDEEAQKRIENKIQTAMNSSAQVLRANKNEEVPHFVPPTLLKNAPEEMIKNEAFAPLLNVIGIKDSDDFMNIANNFSHRLQVAFYSQDTSLLEKAANELNYGGVALNKSSSIRVDALPYGGRALSGIGTECPRLVWEFCAPYKTIYK
jgi:acyl-CoA reductase-like NAD-dependent aldehyde dehydrogenase